MNNRKANIKSGGRLNYQEIQEQIKRLLMHKPQFGAVMSPENSENAADTMQTMLKERKIMDNTLCDLTEKNKKLKMLKDGAAGLLEEAYEENKVLRKRQELLEKVAEAATALDEYDDYYIHAQAEITLNKALEKTLTKLKESEA